MSNILKLLLSALAASLLLASPAQADDLDTARTVQYVFQGVDATLSGIESNRYGDTWHEKTGWATRFLPHAGIAGYVAAFAAQDLIVGALVRRWDPKAKVAVAYYFAGASGYGITFTVRHCR